MAFLDYPGLQRFTSKFKAWVNGIVGNSDMGTTATTLTGAIAEHTDQIANSVKVYTITGTVTNVSGSYTGTFNDERVTAEMKAIRVEVSDVTVFRDAFTVTCGSGYITVTCPSVVGTTTISVDVIKRTNDSTSVTSTFQSPVQILYSAVMPPTSPHEGMVWLKQAPMSLDEAKVLILSTTVSSLPTTISSSDITSDMTVVKCELSDITVQLGDITVTTSAGSLTIAGSISGSTTITLYLLRSR